MAIAQINVARFRVAKDDPANAAFMAALDHVNAHKHFHLHPTVLGLILRIGRDFGLQAMRLPREAGGPLLLRPWLALLRRRLERAGIAHNDFVDRHNCYPIFLVEECYHHQK